MDAAILRAIDQQIERTVRNGCWFWPGPMNNGSPKYNVSSPRRELSVRRVLWQRVHGLDEDVERLKPSCGRQRCVNPQHVLVVYKCTICRRPDREIIESAVYSGHCTPLIAAQYEVEPSALKRHRRGHMVVQRRGRIADIKAASAEARQRAVAWLRERLSHGPVPVRDIRRLAAEAGVKPKHLEYARHVVDVRHNFVGLDGGRPSRPALGQSYRRVYRLPTEDEVRERDEGIRRVGPPIKTRADVEARLRLNFAKRETHWYYLRAIKNWVARAHHETAVQVAEDLHQQGWLEKLVDQQGTILAYRYLSMASVIDPEGRNHKNAGPIVIVAAAPKQTVGPPGRAVSQMAERIYQALMLKGVAMSTNQIHNHLGSASRGAAPVFNAALEQLVEDGRVSRTRVGKTNYYEVLEATNQQATA